MPVANLPLATASAGPGRFGVPVRAWIMNQQADEYGGSSPKGLIPDRLSSYFANPAGQLTPGVIRGGAAAPLQMPTTVQNLFVRKTGSDNNGGSSNGTAPDRTGADGVTNGTTTFTSASANFTAADTNELINIVTKGRYRIMSVSNTTTVILSGSPTAGSSLTWNLGGAVLTVAALLANANAAVLGGDRVWIGAGTYRETISVGVSPTSELRIEGDVDGAMTGDPGMVMITPYTTNDKTAPAAGSTITIASKSYFSFINLVIVAALANTQGACCVEMNTNPVHDILFSNCAFLRAGHSGTSGVLVRFTAGSGAVLNAQFDRCVFSSRPTGQTGGCIRILATRAASADWDLGVVITNSLFLGPGASGTNQPIGLLSAGSGSGTGGGVAIRNCTFFGAGTGIGFADAFLSTGIPLTVRNSFFSACILAMSAATSGQVVEDFNIIDAATARTNISAGSHSISDGSYATLFHLGQEVQWGGTLRPFLEPMLGSPLLGIAADDRVADLYGRPRPAGGGSPLAAVGAFERGNTFVKNIVTVRTGTNAISITGPGTSDRNLPVDETPTTVSVYFRYDSSYTGPPPQLVIVNGSEAGVPVLASSMVGPANAWEQVAVTFTPTAAGVVTVRIQSNDTSGAGQCFADDLAGA